MNTKSIAPDYCASGAVVDAQDERLALADEPKLLPCPFCGGEPEYVCEEDHHGAFFRLGCKSDECPAHWLYYTEPQDTAEAKIAAWNTRAHGRAAEEAVAWRYKCEDGGYVLLATRLTDAQKARGYYTGDEGEDEVEGNEAVIGPFYWSDETPLCTHPAASQGETGLLEKIETEARRYAEMYQPHSDGRNTFVIFADWIAKLATSSSPPAAQSGVREALDAIPADLEWLIGKGKTRPDEPMYGVQLRKAGTDIILAQSEHDHLTTAIRLAIAALAPAGTNEVKP